MRRRYVIKVGSAYLSEAAGMPVASLGKAIIFYDFKSATVVSERIPDSKVAVIHESEAFPAVVAADDQYVTSDGGRSYSIHNAALFPSLSEAESFASRYREQYPESRVNAMEYCKAPKLVQ